MEAATEPPLLWYPDENHQFARVKGGDSKIGNRTNRLVRVDLPQLAPGFELPDDGHRGLVIGHQSLSDSLRVIVYAAAAFATLHDPRHHYLLACVASFVRYHTRT